MYNSLVVRSLSRLWNIFTLSYEDSFVKRFVNMINKIVELLFRGSFIKNIFVSEKGVIDNSIFYRVYSYIVDFISNILKNWNLYFKRIGAHSVIYKNTSSLFKDDKELISTGMVFVLFLGVGIIGINLIKGFFSGSSYIVAIFFIILSLVGLHLRENYISILDNSVIISFIKGIFTIDEGGDKWW